MKKIIHFILLVTACLLLPMYADWWFIAVFGVLVGFFIPYEKTFSSFALSFLFSFISWSSYTYAISMPNDFILAERMAGVLNMGAYGLILTTGLIAGLSTGLSSASGHSLRQLILRK